MSSQAVLLLISWNHRVNFALQPTLLWSYTLLWSQILWSQSRHYTFLWSQIPRLGGPKCNRKNLNHFTNNLVIYYLCLYILFLRGSAHVVNNNNNYLNHSHVQSIISRGTHILYSVLFTLK